MTAYLNRKEKMMPARRLTPLILILATLSLIPLIPGGPIENRSFGHIPVPVLVAFNAFITVTVLGSVPLAFLARRGGRRILTLVVLDGLGYVAIFALDLLHIFPVSPTPMSPTLFGFEIAGLGCGLLIVASALRDMRRPRPQPAAHQSFPALARTGLILAAVLAAGFAVIFGTIGALH